MSNLGTVFRKRQVPVSFWAERRYLFGNDVTSPSRPTRSKLRIFPCLGSCFVYQSFSEALHRTFEPLHVRPLLSQDVSVLAQCFKLLYIVHLFLRILTTARILPFVRKCSWITWCVWLPLFFILLFREPQRSLVCISFTCFRFCTLYPSVTFLRFYLVQEMWTNSGSYILVVCLVRLLVIVCPSLQS